MIRRFVLIMFQSLVISLMMIAAVAAQNLQIENGLNYLLATQNPDGSWNGLVNKGMLPTTVAVIETLSALGQSNSPNYTNAVSWMQAQQNQDMTSSDYLSERIHALGFSGADDEMLLAYVDVFTGAWGGDDSPDVDILDTLLALQALKKINYPDQNIISSALFYLTSNQNQDGGWGLKQGMDSEVYYTALVLSTLQQFSLTTTLATAINKATSYLIAHQNPDGGFGSGGGSGQGIGTGSTVYETALAIIALINGNTGQGSALPLQNAITYLLATQLPNGSWDDDPYSTSLALTKTIGLSSFTDRQGSL